MEEILQFLVVEKGFSEDRVKSSLEKLKKAVHEPKQERITNFFTVQEAPKRKVVYRITKLNCIAGERTSKTREPR